MIEKKHQCMLIRAQAGSFTMKEPSMLVCAMLPYVYNLYLEFQTASAVALVYVAEHVQEHTNAIEQQLPNNTNLPVQQSATIATANHNDNKKTTPQRSNSAKPTSNHSGSQSPTGSQRPSQDRNTVQDIKEKFEQIQSDIEAQSYNDRKSDVAPYEQSSSESDSNAADNHYRTAKHHLFLAGLGNTRKPKQPPGHTQPSCTGRVGQVAGVVGQQQVVDEIQGTYRMSSEIQYTSNRTADHTTRVIGGTNGSLGWPQPRQPLNTAPTPHTTAISYTNVAQSHRCHPYRAPDHYKPLVASSHKHSSGYSFCQRCPPTVCGLAIPPELRVTVTARRGHRELARDLQNKEAAKKNRERAKAYAEYLNEVARQLSWQIKCRKEDLEAKQARIARMQVEYEALHAQLQQRLQQQPQQQPQAQLSHSNAIEDTVMLPERHQGLNAITTSEVTPSPLLSTASTPSVVQIPAEHSTLKRSIELVANTFAWAEAADKTPAMDLWALDLAMTNDCEAAYL